MVTKKTQAAVKEPSREKDPAFKAVDDAIPKIADELTASFTQFIAKIAAANAISNPRTNVALENYGYRRLMNEIIWKMRLPLRFERKERLAPKE